MEQLEDHELNDLIRSVKEFVAMRDEKLPIAFRLTRKAMAQMEILHDMEMFNEILPTKTKLIRSLKKVTETQNPNDYDLADFCRHVISSLEEERECRIHRKPEKDDMAMLNYHSEFVAVFRDQLHADIKVKPGQNGPSIPAHKFVLAIRSEILKIMLELDSDGCKTITLPDLNHEELESFLEFLYSGSLPEEKMEKHLYPLSRAADKYKISHLQKCCEQHMIESLSSSNAFDVLKFLNVSSYPTVMEAASNFIRENRKDTHLSLHIKTD